MNIKNLISHIQRKGAFSKASSKHHSQRDWLLMVSITLFLFLIIAVWNYISFQFSVSDRSQTMENQRGVELKTNSTDTVQALFEKRAQLRAEYQTGAHFVDPSR